MFVAWCMLHDLAWSLPVNEFPDDLNALKERRVTPGRLVIDACDEKFTDDELNDEGNAFATAYFGPPKARRQYLTDYEETLSDELSLYHIKDSWENYEKLSPVIERRFVEWKDGTLQTIESKDFDLGAIVNKKTWWKLW